MPLRNCLHALGPNSRWLSSRALFEMKRTDVVTNIASAREHNAAAVLAEEGCRKLGRISLPLRRQVEIQSNISRQPAKRTERSEKQALPHARSRTRTHAYNEQALSAG